MPTLTILHTNDLHARFEAITRLATLIQRERASAHADAPARHLLLLDAGDSSSGEVWESEVTAGRANYAMLEAMGYDAAAVGNADTAWGREALLKLIASVHFAPLAANIRDAASNTPLASLRPYTLFHFDGLTVAVVGLTTNEYSHPDLQCTDPTETLRALLPQLQAEGAHLIIVLSHLGFEADQHLAAAVPGIHLLLGGHTHTVLRELLRVGETVIAQAGDYGNYLGRIDVTYDDVTHNIVAINGHLIPCNEAIPPDPTLAGMLDLIRFEAKVVRKKKVGGGSTTPAHL